MGLSDQLLHFVNFCAPALAVGVVLAIVGPMFMKKRPPALGFIGHIAINCIAGVSAMGLGLWYFGNDGKMASYAAMVVAIASSQWLVAQGRR